MDKLTVTKEGYQKLQTELDERVNIKREAIKAALQEARSQGDLSENAEYDSAKTEQGKNELRIAELQEILRTAIIVEIPTSTAHVHIGSAVTVDDGGTLRDYIIVGPTEIDISSGKISDNSPVGRALLGHKKGDKVNVTLPRGTKTLIIKEIK